MANDSAGVCVCLVSQAQPTSIKEGKGLVNCVHKLCPAALYSAVHSHYSILSHDALCHCLGSNSSLENSKRELGHLLCYCRNCKNTLPIVLRERAYSATGNSRLHYLKSGYVIQLIAFRWNTACIHSSPDPSLLFWKWVGLARLLYVYDCLVYMCVSHEDVATSSPGSSIGIGRTT